MKKLDWLVFKTFLGPFVFTFFIVIFVLLMQFFWIYIEDIVGKGLEIWIVIKLILYVSATLIPIALPLAILLSSIMAMGNLGESLELTAMKSSGISLQRVMRPLTIFIIFVSIGAFLFMNYAIPYCNLKTKNLLYNISKAKPTLNIKAGSFTTLIDGYSIRVEKKYGKNETLLKDVLIYDYTNGYDNIKSTTAQRGEMKVENNILIFSLYDGYSYENQKTKNYKEKKNLPFSKTKFKTQIINIKTSDLANSDFSQELFKDNYSMLNITQLDANIDTLNLKNYNQIREFAAKNYTNLIRHIDTLYAKKEIKDNFISLFNEKEKLRVLEMASTQIRQTHRDLKEESKYLRYRSILIAKHKIEWHKKFAIATICLIMFFVGAPLGAIIRKGGLGLPVVIATCLFSGYIFMSNAGDRMGKQLAMTPFLAMWYSVIILGILGIFFTKKATSDSSLFLLEKYYAQFEKIWTFIKKIFLKRNNYF